MSGVGVRTIKVVGEGTFPMDMLRYGRFWPYDSDAVRGITASLTELDDKVRTITLALAIPGPSYERRWKSRGWIVREE